jgi:hypothetical protein
MHCSGTHVVLTGMLCRAVAGLVVAWSQIRAPDIAHKLPSAYCFVARHLAELRAERHSSVGNVQCTLPTLVRHSAL